MTTVYKYQFQKHSNEMHATMPYGAKVLSVADQDNHITLWAEVDPDIVERQERKFVFFGTGRQFEYDVRTLQFIGTVIQASGKLVWHVYEIVRSQKDIEFFHIPAAVQAHDLNQSEGDWPWVALISHPVVEANREYLVTGYMLGALGERYVSIAKFDFEKGIWVSKGGAAYDITHFAPSIKLPK